jgi:O-antigen ligase
VNVRAGELPWDPLLVCVAAYILIAVGRIHQLFPALQALRPAILTGLVAIGLYLVAAHRNQRAALLWVPPTKWLVALLVWMMLAVPGAIWPGNSFAVVFDNFVKTVLMYVVVAGSARGVRDVERLAGAYLAAATIYAAIVLTRFDVGSGEAWRLGRLYYYDANDFATFIVTALPSGLYFAHAGRRRSLRLAAMAALLILTVVLVQTGSRGGFLAFVAVATFVLLRYKAIAVRWRVSAFAFIAVVLIATASDQYWRQMSTIVSDADYNQTEESGRLQIWRRGMGYMLGRPIFGVGPGNFQMAEGTLSPFATRQQFGVGVRWNAAHSSFVQIAAETGVPGFVFFVMMIVSAFAALGSRRRSRAPAEAAPELTQALTAALIGFAVGGFFLSLAYSEMLYTLVALVVGLQKVTQQGADRV